MLKNNTLYSFFLAIVLLSLTGCSSHQFGRGTFGRTNSLALTQEERARIHDISFPLNVEPIKLLFTESQMVISFVTELSQTQLIKDYRAGMEYWGWHEIGRIAAQESCLIFIKPSKVCSIILRPEGLKIRVVLFSTIKSGS